MMGYPASDELRFFKEQNCDAIPLSKTPNSGFALLIFLIKFDNLAK